jgi:hypothetical protein
MTTLEINHTFISKRGNTVMTCAVCGATKQVGSSQQVKPVCYTIEVEDEPAPVEEPPVE